VLGISDGAVNAVKAAAMVTSGISDGDILDMRGNQVTKAFIQGREVSLDNKQKQLYERYKYKYSLK
jgi:uncharacterized protein YccT (UPF0319 family)